MSERPEIFWTVAVRYRGEELKVLTTDKLELGAPLLGEEPHAQPERHGLRHKAVARAIQALLDGAESVEIFRFPPLTTTTTNQK